MLNGGRVACGEKRYPVYNSRKSGCRGEGGAGGRCISFQSSVHLAECQAPATKKRLPAAQPAETPALGGGMDESPHGLQPVRLLCPWNSSCQNTGVGSCSILQGIFLTQGLNPGLLHCRWILYQLSHKGSPVYGNAGFIKCVWKVSLPFTFL